MKKVRRSVTNRRRKVRATKMGVSKPHKTNVPKPNFWHAR